ncbi:MAG TPA: hypothetical protein VJT49_11605 [Amycolatopsis sp.]|uniref:hypothetical protein n=1 Tax=Amycolatopsis sp. TaxID=37632 RepID=UPI002B497BD4|nr:hypothetical protein [Amycolatopsis sp.]HKS45733.1 hypothetical protein [Amycolatopsis sp.]
MAATVGGLWHSLLAEGKPWWITATSDSHNVHADTSVRGPGTDFTTNGFHNDPVYSPRRRGLVSRPVPAGPNWPRKTRWSSACPTRRARR